jgi:adenylate cyclase
VISKKPPGRGSRRSGSTSGPSGSPTDRRAPRAVIAVVAGALALGWAIVLAGRPVGGIDDRLNDALLRLRHALRAGPPVDASIVHLDLTDASGETPGGGIPLAGLIVALADAGVASIVLDIIARASPDPRADLRLADTVRLAGNVVSAVIVDRDGRLVTGSAAFAAASRGSGHVNAEPDRDGVNRRVAIVLPAADGWVPGLALAAACEALGVAPSSIEVVPGSSVRIPGARMRAGAVRDIEIPVDRANRMIVNWTGGWGDAFPHYTAAGLLDAAGDADRRDEFRRELEGARVIVGDVTTAGGDHGPTPFEQVYPLAGLHANVLNGILTARFLRPQRWYESALASLVFAAALGACFALLRPFAATASALVCGVAMAGLQFALLVTLGVMPRLAAPALGLAFGAVGANAVRYLQAERERIAARLRLERYFAPQLMAKILKAPQVLVGAEQKTLTVLFSDIAGFTAWCSRQPPAAVHATLNEYFEEMTAIVFRHEGTVDKFIGDGLMAFFGDPLAQPDHALRAVRAAVEMQQAARRLRAAWEPSGRLPLAIRVGINTGEVIVGDMGSRRITAYTAIGAAVNLAQRLEANAPVGGILVSEPVRRAAGDGVPMRPRGRITAKGIAEAFEVWEVELPDASP